MKHLDFSGTKNACHAALFHADFQTCRTWQVRHVDGAAHLRAPLKLVSEQLLSSIVSRACLPTNQPAEFMSKSIGSPLVYFLLQFLVSTGYILLTDKL